MVLEKNLEILPKRGVFRQDFVEIHENLKDFVVLEKNQVSDCQVSRLVYWEKGGVGLSCL